MDSSGFEDKIVLPVSKLGLGGRGVCRIYAVLRGDCLSSAERLIRELSRLCKIEYYVLTCYKGSAAISIIASSEDDARVDEGLIRRIVEKLRGEGVLESYSVACSRDLEPKPPVSPQGYSGFEGENLIVMPSSTASGLLDSLITNERFRGISRIMLEYMGRSLGLEYSRVLRDSGVDRLDEALRSALKQVESMNIASLKSFNARTGRVSFEVEARGGDENSAFIVECIVRGMVMGLIEGLGARASVRAFRDKGSGRIKFIVSMGNS